MSETNWKLGDVVRLKSGGPSMTITRIGTIHGAPAVWCGWFNQEGSVFSAQEGSFTPEALVRG